MLPSLQVGRYRDAVNDYLRTTFALTEHDVVDALDRFLHSDTTGMFRGPYLRIRMPFAAAHRPATDVLEWYGAPYPPHGHQLAAFERLATTQAGLGGGRPLPTLVTTGTGSGKTEAFLLPILDHVRRARRAGVTGIKALILYPMNALVNDQARRLAELLADDPDLAGITAGTYIGETDAEHSRVSRAHLITDRRTMRVEAPDLLLTNYKMLDQLLLRPLDQPLWQQSATSLRYLVLDEFHSYDGAQGTDVAMLLRRLGLALKRHWPADPAARAAHGIDAAAEAAPLGLVTPVATSATLGGDDPTVMVDFANTVFGGGFDAASVVGETRLDVDDWAAAADGPPIGGAPRRLTGLGGERVAAERLADLAAAPGHGPLDLARAVLAELYHEGGAFADADARTLHDALRRHPDIVALVRAAASPLLVDDLAARLIGGSAVIGADAAGVAIAAIIGALSQVRAAIGFAAPSVDLHAWIREVTRIDRVAGPTAAFRWGDDGREEQAANDDAYSDEGREAMPALYCRHCGRSGWGVVLSTVGEQRDLAAPSAAPRRERAQNGSQFRALVYAPAEADELLDDTAPAPGFGWWGVLERRIHAVRPDDTDEASADTNVLPVRWLEGPDAAKESCRDTCPSCGQVDGIRFVGAAVATLLSVVVTSMFGDAELDDDDKKALVFTDSVQDAAHRAGFVQSRSHVFGFRNAVRRALDEGGATVNELAERMLQQARSSRERYRLLAPDVVEREQFRRFWQPELPRQIDARTRRLVRRRLEFDLALEFGLQSTFARTLERTSSVTVEVDTDSAAKLEGAARAAIDGFSFTPELGGDAAIDGPTLIAWARGALEHLRERGGIDHEWLRPYLAANGLRWRIWGGRPKGEGMPAFPPGRAAPAFARDGADRVPGRYESGLDGLGSARGWYARWTSRLLSVPADHGAQLVRRLFAQLAETGLVTAHVVEGIGTAYGLDPARLLVQHATPAERANGRTALRCRACNAVTAASPRTVEQLRDRPCPVERCTGTLAPHPVDEGNYYRRLYDDGDMRRVVAREHTSMLPNEVRLEYEQQFKASAENADAPNVLIATPTLEMGIDIGDLSTVLLASLPRTVANYVQRVGRAGRRTGSALTLAFAPGRLDQLGWYHQPLALIDGEVHAPATYLDAREIAKRQLLAALVDRLSARGELGFAASANAQQVLGSTAEGTALGALIDAVHDAGEPLDEFVGAFGARLGHATVAALRAWLAPGVDGVVPAAADIAAASTEYAEGQERLSRRIRDLEAVIDELQRLAAAPAAADEAADELRAALTTRRLLRGVRHSRSSEFWVSALERAGLLPNYSLLDDRVTLDVGVSWVDADTGDYSHETFEYSRNAGNAIREFAPGAKFYARGLEIGIDGVETGADGEHVHDWVLCAECGYVRDLTADPADRPLGACPRCGDSAFADIGQRMHVLELEAVSAEVRRDEAQIGDGTEERERTRFQLVDFVDIDPNDVERRWFDAGTGLGVTYARALVLRTVNLGLDPEVAGGTSRRLGGLDLTVPLFRVCRECGKLDRRAGENSWREHRPWCSHRRLRNEDPVTVALSRTLRTQGIRLRLPARLTVGNDYALPSLLAALRLGLRRVIGGDPDHLDLVLDVDVDDSGTTHPAVLIHDRVPGGTGYLADHASPEGLARILLAALDVVEHCPCRHEHRSACHRCLLPHTNPAQAPSVWRKSAAEALRLLLGHDEHGDEPIDAHGWEVRAADPGRTESGSDAERRFVQALLKGAESLMATTTQQPGTRGNTITIALPHGELRIVRPQVDLSGSRPDFVLESKNAAHGSLAVFVDGRAFHATAARNRLADDAAKRALLRERPGTVVVSVTVRDIDEYLRGESRRLPGWIAEHPSGGKLQQQSWLSASDVERLAENPMKRIVDWLANPDAARASWERVARALPMLVLGLNEKIGGDDLGAAALAALDGEAEEGSTATQCRWRAGDLAVVARFTGKTKTGPPSVAAAVVLDDADAALEGPEACESWWEWLHWGNVVGLLADTEITVRSLVAERAGAAPAGEPRPAEAAVDVAWPGAVEATLGDPGEHERLRLVHAGGIAPEPVVGEEAGDGIPVFAHWVAEGIIWDPDLVAADRDALAGTGLVVLTGPAADVIDWFRERKER